MLKERASVRRLSYRMPERLLSSLREEVNLKLSHPLWVKEHLKHLEKLLACFQSAMLTVNFENWAFFQTETEYLGFVIGNR